MRTRLVFLACAAASIPVCAIGQTSWTGANSTAWFQSGNWTPMVVPDVSANTMPTHAVIVGPNAFNRAATTGANNQVEILTLHVGIGGEVEISGSSKLEVFAGGNALHIQGLIDMQPPSSGNHLGIGADTTLFGGGEILMRGGNSIRGATGVLAPATERLTNLDVLIHGAGRIGGQATDPAVMKFTNRASVIADIAGQTLLVEAANEPDAIINTGFMSARNGGVLAFTQTTFSTTLLPVTNFEPVTGGTLLGTIRAEAGSRTEFQRVTVSGGFIDVVGNGEIRLRGATHFAGGGVSNSSSGVIRITESINTIRSSLHNPVGGQVLVDAGTLGFAEHAQTRNEGTIQLSGSLSEANVELLTDFTLRGGGTVIMGSATRRGTIAGSAQPGTELLLNDDNLIRGQGLIGSTSSNLRLHNRGTIDANINAKELLIFPFTDATNSLINRGTIRATNGGIATLSLSGSTDIARRLQNYEGATPGFLRGEGTGLLKLNNVFVDGGTLESTGDATILTTSVVTLKPAVINLNGQLYNSSGTLTIEAPVNVGLNGELVNGSSGNTTINAATTFTGFALNATLQSGSIIVQSTAPATFGNVNLISGTLDVRTAATAADIEGLGTTRVSLGARLDAFSVRSRGVLIDTNGKLSIVDSIADPLTEQVCRVTQMTFGTGGKFDLGSQALIRDFASGTTDGAVLAWVQSGREGGAWNGIGINTSAPTAHHGIGFAVAANLFTSFPQTWLGQSIDSSTSLLRYTLLGDSNLDGDVDFDDVLVLAQNYGGTSKRWDQGDSNYDGNVNFDDLLPLAQNYGQAVARERFADLPANIVSDWLLAQSFIPEPVGVLAFAASLSIGACRRRVVGVTAILPAREE